MLRVHTSMLKQARSTFMINLLKYGEIVSEEEPPAQSHANSGSHWPLNSTSLGNLDELLSEHHDAGDYSDDLQPPRTPNLRSPQRNTWSTSDQTIYSPGGQSENGPRTGGGRIPPSVAESVTAAGSDAGIDHPDQHNGPVEITHEIWFRAPSHIKRADIQRRHHMATRNYLALL